MTGPSCDRAALVEAMFDGRLGPSERASSERHLESCASCAEFARDLISLQQLLRSSSTPISPLEHQRARLALLRQSAKPSTPKRKPAALLVVALLMLPLAAWAAVSKIAPLIGAEKSGEEAAPAKPSNAQHAQRKPATTRALDVSTQLAGTAAPATPPAPEAVPNVLERPSVSSDSSSQPSASETKATPAAAVTPSPRRIRHEPRVAHMPTAPATAASRASRDFAEAMQALSRGDFGAGATKLASFTSAYPRDPRVEDAVYLEAIALERAGRTADAKATAQRYLAEYPEGAHRAQARRIAGE